jgi:hypothetical protein
MKNKFLPTLLFIGLLSIMIYSCSADDGVDHQKNSNTVLRARDTINQPSLPNPKG